MDEYYEDGYEIEPFMPGISPVGKGTPGISEVSVPRPYIPYGTGYDVVRPRPGYSALKSDLSGMGRVELDKVGPYSMHKWGTRISSTGDFARPVKQPQNYYDIQEPRTMKDALEKGNYQIRMNHQPNAEGANLKPYGYPEVNAPNRRLYADGWERGSYMPTEDTIAYEADNSTAKRHQIMRALQARGKSGLGTIGNATGFYPQPPREMISGDLDGQAAYKKDFRNLEAKIGANKSLRKGFEDFINKPANEAERLRDYSGGEPTRARKFKEAAAKVARAIPGKPGMFTGRVPSMQGLGGGLVDMFMEGPALQEAKNDPYTGMGEEERARIEAAYQYGL